MNNPLRVRSQDTHTVDRMLSAEYFCDVTRNEAKICMQLKSHRTHGAVRSSHSWCFVIDVSGSMMTPGKDGMTMIDRVKFFAGLAKNLVCDDDFIAIISFADRAETNMKLTKMDSQGKCKVVDCLGKLRVGGSTNIEAGLVRAFDEMLSAKTSGLFDEKTTLSVIIFTDGIANSGTTDGAKMISKYREMERRLGQNVRVPISAFTVGSSRPDLLIQMSAQLGSEAFYWLDESKDFEADMMLPIKLREMTLANNVQIVVRTMSGAIIYDKSDEHLVNHSPESLIYFLHMLPMGIPKIFQVCLELPPMSLQERRGQVILDITTTYYNEKVESMELHDVLTLTGESILESCASELPDPSEIDDSRLQALEQTCSFVCAEKNYQTSWVDVKKAILMNFKTEYLRCAVRMGQSEINADSAELAVQPLQSRIENIIQNQNDRDYEKWVDEVTKITEAFQKARLVQNPCRFHSMASALARSMPAPVGVLDESSKLDGKAWIRDINNVVEEAKESVRKNESEKLDFKALHSVMEKDAFKRNLVVLKQSLAKTIENAKAALKHVKPKPSFDSDLFRGYTFVLSPQLQNRDQVARTIESHHGEIEQNLSHARRSRVYVIMESDGATTDTALFSEASIKQAGPIVGKSFVHDCIAEDRILGWYKYEVKRPRR